MVTSIHFALIFLLIRSSLNATFYGTVFVCGPSQIMSAILGFLRLRGRFKVPTLLNTFKTTHDAATKTPQNNAHIISNI